ncbi:hypothetical protein [Streptomyces cavernae]|uniref:Rv1733c family protein n=1 Tax=Streptomyces cavernae TaxID=2259034 RepID=UPI001EE3F6B6|nr:hypothetical protein [Streptomyces cavernae]
MAKTQSKRRLAALGLWRWRRSPLRRRSDLVEAWVLLLAWVLAVLGGVLAGLLTAVAADRSFDRQRAERQEVAATVVKGPKEIGSEASDRMVADDRVWATVRWTGRDGAVHTASTQVAADTTVGTRISLWVDGDSPATQPLQPGEALLEASLLGGLAAVATGGLVWAGASGARGCLERRRMTQWDEDWQRMDTRWGRKTG